MQNSLRTPDIMARFGGDEFVVLLPETDHKKALLTAERLRKLVETNPVVTERGEIHVTLSMGISSYAAGKSASLDQLLEHADRALYLSKEAGRNHATAWVDETVPVVEV